MIEMIWAQDIKGGIGYKNELLFSVKEDMKIFMQKTKQAGHVLMGRKTYESIISCRGSDDILPDRHKFVLTRDKDRYSSRLDTEFIHSFDELNALHGFEDSPHKNIMVIGGSEIYSALIHRAQKLHVTGCLLNCSHVDSFAPNFQAWLPNTRRDPALPCFFKQSSNSFPVMFEKIEVLFFHEVWLNVDKPMTN